MIWLVPVEAAMRIEHEARRGGVRAACILSLLVGLWVIIAGFGCSPSATATSSPPLRPQIPSAVVQSPVSVPAPLDINRVVDQWVAGEREEAICALLELGESQSAPASYRLYARSELVGLPAAEEEAVGEKITGRARALWEITSEANRRAKQVAIMGEFSQAEKFFGTLRRLGTANRGRGSDLMLMVDQIGGTMEEVADAGFSELNRRRSKAAASAPASLHLNNVLDCWVAGRREEAIRMLLDLSESQIAPSYYRPFELSEQQVAALPLAKREALKVNMLAGLDVLREVVRDMERRGKEAAAAGEFDTAKRMFLALKRVGAANRGPEVNLLVGSVGNVTEFIADKGLSDLKKEWTRQPTAP